MKVPYLVLPPVVMSAFINSRAVNNPLNGRAWGGVVNNTGCETYELKIDPIQFWPTKQLKKGK